MNFIRILWRALTSIKDAIGNIVFLLIFMAVLFAIFSSDIMDIEDYTAQVLNLRGAVVEQRSSVNPLDELVNGDFTSETVFRDILLAISTAKSDKKISALVLDLSNLSSITMGHLEEVGNALEDFKASNKPILAFAPSYSQDHYLIAS